MVAFMSNKATPSPSVPLGFESHLLGESTLVHDNVNGLLTQFVDAVPKSQGRTSTDHGHEEELHSLLISSDKELGLDTSCVGHKLQVENLSDEHLRVNKKDKKGRKPMVAKKKQRFVIKKNSMKQRKATK